MEKEIKKAVEKLQVKHLAPYLPYDLKMHTNAGVWDLVVYKAQPEYKYGVMIGEAINCGVKPILKPIEDLYNSNTDCGIKIVHYFNFKTNVKLDCKNFPYHVMEKLFKNHFDVFGLIDKGLAIDFNTI